MRRAPCATNSGPEADVRPRIFTDARMLAHMAGEGHPESPARLEAVHRALAAGGFPVCGVEFPDLDRLAEVHPRHYLDLLAATATAPRRFDADTAANEATWDAARLAAAAAIAAAGMAAEGGTAFAAARPPGHHALADQAMGFCFLANAVLAAREAARRGRDRVLIVDWDVHHGNGTAALVEDDPRIRYVSLHQWPAYPGTGRADERGRAGNLFHVPLPPGLPREAYVEGLWSAVVAATTGWHPEVLVISAGFDAMAGDPLAGFTLEPEDYATLTHRMRERFPRIGIASLLEGGYRPDRLAAGVLAHLNALA